MTRKLTEKQKRFVAAYDGNATEAARKAGYSKKTAKVIASENLTKPDIQAAIVARESQVIKPLIATREDRQRFWTAVLAGAAPPPPGKTEPVPVSTADRLRAAEMLGKSEGDFLDKLQVSGSIEIKGLVFKPYKTRQDAPESTIDPKEVSNTLDP